MAQDTCMERTIQERQEVIQIHLHTKSGVEFLNGPTVYLLVLLLRRMQAPKESYIGRMSMTGLPPSLPPGGIPVLGSKAMRLATTEDKAIYTIQDALMLDMYPEQSLIAIKEPAVHVPRMESAAPASRLDTCMVPLPWLAVLQSTNMMIL